MSDLSALHIRASGTGPTIVATHGLGDDLDTFGALAPRLNQAGYRVVSWDLPGHGRSREVEVTNSGTGLAALEYVVGLQKTPVILLGHSLGGYLSLAYAARHMPEVSALVLISTGPGFRDIRARAAWNAYIDRVARKMDLTPGTAVICHQADSQAIDSLPSLTVPVLHLVGDADDRYRNGALYMETALPSSRLVTIEGAHHHPQTSHAESVSEYVLEFLSATTSATAISTGRLREGRL